MAKKIRLRKHKGLLRGNKHFVEIKPSLDEIFLDAAAKDFKRVEVFTRESIRRFGVDEETGEFRELPKDIGRQFKDNVVVQYGLDRPIDKLRQSRKPKRGPGMGH